MDRYGCDRLPDISWLFYRLYPAEAEELFQAAEDNAKWRYNNYKRLANQAWGVAE